MTVAEEVAPSVLLATAAVRRTERISPAFQRVTLSSPDFADLGEDGFDTRIKLVFPSAVGTLPEVPDRAEEWYDAWLAMPEDERCPMRTYTVRDIVREGEETLLVVDFVVHESVMAEGHDIGPACRWALAATPGNRIQVIGPRRGGAPYGGAEFDPGDLRDLLLVGDETAVPAITRILADLPAGYRGRVFLEVPSEQDFLDLEVPDGFSICWVARQGEGYGRPLAEEVRRNLGLAPLDPTAERVVEELPSDLDIDIWETPRYSSSGEDVESQLARRGWSDLAGTYAWIAGESWAVKVLRRALVDELAVDRGRVAFMGYWREGVAMKG